MPTKDPLGELLPPLSRQEALTESNRCLYCYDAPCTHACPTHIDIPLFIKKIATGNLLGSATTILQENLLGATCARVCPVQELCEGACVLGSEHRPIAIGRLQRHAMDSSTVSLNVAPSTGRSIAVIGSGPAGLSCAGTLAKAGHCVTLFEKRELAGGLSTYGIISLREPIEVALKEVEMIKSLGVQVETGKELGSNLNLASLRQEYDAVFLSVGLGRTPRLNIPGEEFILDGLAYIEDSKTNPCGLKVGKQVAVIGAGNTAIDCATVAKRLGAEKVTMVYRRTEAEITAYPHEVAFIRGEGAEFKFLAQPVSVSARGLQCISMELGDADASGRKSSHPVPGSEFVIPADQIVKAIGQEKHTLGGFETVNGYLKVSESFETSIPGVYAGGDCIRAQGEASTVMAVQDGKLAARSIHRSLGA